MKKQILNYNIAKAKRNLHHATTLLMEAAGIIERIDPAYKINGLVNAPDFLADIANGFMTLYDEYDELLLDTWYGKDESSDDEI